MDIDTVDAVVFRVEEYGVYLNYGDYIVLVLIPDVSIERVKCLKNEFFIGQKARVYLGEYIPQKGLFKGSFVHPSLRLRP